MTPVLLLILSAAPQVELHSLVDGKATRGWVYARRGQAVTLVASVKGGEPAQIRWLKLEPTAGAVDNTQPSFHFEPIPYREVEVTGCAGALTCPADVRSGSLPAPAGFEGVGTMAFQVQVTLKDGRRAATPGLESQKYGGLTQAVHRVTVRQDDTLLGYATELFGTPYIFGSAGPDGRNQSDLLIGSDCADLIIYARRRSGRRAEYVSSYTIDRQAPPLGKGQPVQAGDLVHFPSTRHVALLFRDTPPLGEVNASDLILHTCWAPPTIQPLGESGCASEPYRALRFPTRR